MIRRMLDDLLWHFRKHTGPGQARYFLRQLTRKPMATAALSIDPSGEWSMTKARRVLDVIQPEAKEHGLFFQALEITNFSMPHKRFILVAYCIEHEIAVVPGTLCSECARHAK